VDAHAFDFTRSFDHPPIAKEFDDAGD